PMAINQLIAHHAVVFQPAARRMWVSAGPYQSGPFVGYDLREVFARCAAGSVRGAVHDPQLTIAEDPFVRSGAFARYRRWSAQRVAIAGHVLGGRPYTMDAAEEARFIGDCPECYATYQVLGDLRRAGGDPAAAAAFYRKALEKEVASLQERERIERQLRACLEATGE